MKIMGLKELEKIYETHAKIYDLTRWIFVWNRKKAIDKLDLEEGESVLVVGCGTGYEFKSILKKIGEAGKIIGIDYSKHMLDKARKKIEKNCWKNIELVQADAAKYFSPKVDAVLYSYSVTMIPDWRKSLQNSFEALKTGGKLVIVDFSEIRIPILKQILNYQFKQYGVHNKLPIQTELKKYFKNVEFTKYFAGYNFITKGVK